ncbi:hypothetical protein Vafri_16271 [Volvox africanus]|uniref:RING-CH-type domain-containing protein n=1 Tax=Volvox africanus TaxID=51714 RepID=A0A8J4BJE6_9CHLO|nr:hypothetical protein Vafri_16271 [Volvox africanus]
MRLTPSPHDSTAGIDSTEEDSECEGRVGMDRDVQCQYSHADRGKQRQDCGDGGCGATAAVAATVATATPATEPQPQPSEFVDLGPRGLPHTKGGEDESQGSAYGDGEESDAQEGDEECSTPECWLCYGGGRVALHINAATVNGSEDGGGGQPRGSSSGVVTTTAPGTASCAEGTCRGGGNDTEDELAMPCRICSGGLRYIHRGCFQRWLDISWAIACPNCRTLYDRAAATYPVLGGRHCGSWGRWRDGTYGAGRMCGAASKL